MKNYTCVCSLNEEDEPKWLLQLSEGSLEAYTSLYKYYQPKLYRFIQPFTASTPHDINEILQDIFIKIWLKKEAFAGIKSFEQYLYKMAGNKLIDLHRSRKAQQKHETDFAERISISDEVTEKELQYREYHSLAQKAIDLLSERKKKIYNLSMQCDLSLDEISSELQLSKDVVKKQLYLACRFIKDYIRKHGDIAFTILSSIIIAAISIV